MPRFTFPLSQQTIYSDNLTGSGKLEGNTFQQRWKGDEKHSKRTEKKIMKTDREFNRLIVDFICTGSMPKRNSDLEKQKQEVASARNISN